MIINESVDKLIIHLVFGSMPIITQSNIFSVHRHLSAALHFIPLEVNELIVQFGCLSTNKHKMTHKNHSALL